MGGSVAPAITCACGAEGVPPEPGAPPADGAPPSVPPLRAGQSRHHSRPMPSGQWRTTNASTGVVGERRWRAAAGSSRLTRANSGSRHGLRRKRAAQAQLAKRRLFRSHRRQRFTVTVSSSATRLPQRRSSVARNAHLLQKFPDRMLLNRRIESLQCISGIELAGAFELFLRVGTARAAALRLPCAGCANRCRLCSRSG